MPFRRDHSPISDSVKTYDYTGQTIFRLLLNETTAAEVNKINSLHFTHFLLQSFVYSMDSLSSVSCLSVSCLSFLCKDVHPTPL